MSKKPKIEFYKINLHKIVEGDLTFRTIFTSLYKANKLVLNIDENVENLNPTDNELMVDFYRHFFANIASDTVKNESKRKAFKVKSHQGENSPNGTVILNSDQNIIQGIIKGGEFDTGKDLSELNNPDAETQKLGANKLITDDFYFLLYTPLDKNIGILMLQSYTKDNIADIFRPFIENLFKVLRLTNKSTTSIFMPKNMQEDFKNASVVKSFVYKNHFIVSDIQDETFQTGEFTINVEIKSNGNQINLNNLPWWRRKLGESILGIPSQEQRSLETFNSKRGYIKSNIGENNPTKFTLDADNIEINATIYLSNYINLEENGVPLWDELKDFVIETLNDDVKPEIYPEDYLNEN